MVSLAGRPWVRDLKAPVAVAVLMLAVAVWKTSNPKLADGEDGERSLQRPSSVAINSSGSSGCGCECHIKGSNRRRRSSSHGEQPKPAVKTVSSGGSSSSSSTKPPQRCCNCPAAIAATAAATALGRRSTSGGGVKLKSAQAGTPRRGRNDRRPEPSSNNGRQRRSKPRDGSLSSDKAAAGAGAARHGTGGHGKRGLNGGGAGGGVGSAAAAPVPAEEGATVESAAVLRRMCRLPGAMLRSGLVYSRVTAVSMPGRGLEDGDIPTAVGRLAGPLRKVDLSGNRLTVVPTGLLRLGAGLEDLNLGHNEIAELPPEIAQLSGLLFFNMAGNRLTALPVEIGRLSALKRLGLKGNALVRLPSSLGDLSHLVELYLTGNVLEALPDEIVKLRRLKKLQLSFNKLRSLPQGMEAMRSLELCRLAVNPGLTVVPEGLTFAERLAWVSLAGSAWCARATEKRRRASFPTIPREEVVLGERLGSGASGDVFAGTYRGEDVAVKIFKSDVGPDGNARDELDVACTVDHPNLTKSLGIIHASPSSGSSSSGGPSSNGSSNGGGGGGMEKFQWLVMERVVGQPLAEKPDFSSVLRCRWGSGRRFEPVLVLAVLLQVARAMSYLHEKAICHGDLYAHNVLVDGETGAAVLCDFGASFFYPKSKQHDSSLLESTEVRAFGLMARDMARRSAGCEWILQDLVPSCLQADASHRPSFHEVINQLHAELMQSVEPSSPMVTSAKSLHSLLDRPDIAAERVRVLSAERRQEPSLTSSSSLVPAPVMGPAPSPASSSASRGRSDALSRGGGDSGNVTVRTGSGVDFVGPVCGSSGGGGGGLTYKRGGSGGRGRGGPGLVGMGGRPVVRLGGVEEGTADDEGGTEDGEGEVVGNPEKKEALSGSGEGGSAAMPLVVGAGSVQESGGNVLVSAE